MRVSVWVYTVMRSRPCDATRIYQMQVVSFETHWDGIESTVDDRRDGSQFLSSHNMDHGLGYAGAMDAACSSKRVDHGDGLLCFPRACHGCGCTSWLMHDFTIGIGHVDEYHSLILADAIVTFTRRSSRLDDDDDDEDGSSSSNNNASRDNRKRCLADFGCVGRLR